MIVSIKPLEWKNYREPGQSARIKAVHPFGEYRIIDNSRDGELWSPELGGINVTFNGWDEAKAAAQADYEARIRSAISAQVQDVAGWQNEEKLTPEQAWTILCETPDITSPEEYPDHALITFEQLQSYMERAHNSVEWKDISTAPRDGTKILMRGGAYHGLPFAGYWDRSPYAPDRPWVSAVNNSRLYEHVPTQWMPLPASPASKHGDADHG